MKTSRPAHDPLTEQALDGIALLLAELAWREFLAEHSSGNKAECAEEASPVDA